MNEQIEKKTSVPKIRLKEFKEISEEEDYTLLIKSKSNSINQAVDEAIFHPEALDDLMDILIERMPVKKVIEKTTAELEKGITDVQLKQFEDFFNQLKDINYNLEIFNKNIDIIKQFNINIQKPSKIKKKKKIKKMKVLKRDHPTIEKNTIRVLGDELEDDILIFKFIRKKVSSFEKIRAVFLHTKENLYDLWFIIEENDFDLKHIISEIFCEIAESFDSTIFDIAVMTFDDVDFDKLKEESYKTIYIKN